MRAKYILVVLGLMLALASTALARSKFKILHNFGSSNDGYTPGGALLLDSHGSLYGGTAGGPGEYGNGTVYNWRRKRTGPGAKRSCTPFPRGAAEQIHGAALILDGAGNLYGTMPLGANYIGGVFELSPGSGGWAYSVLYTENSGPGLVMDKVGKLYGQIGPGQYKYYGAVAELSPGSDGWTYTALYSFCGQQDCPGGYDMPAPPIWDGKGNLTHH